jgi:hypothetical protein
VSLVASPGVIRVSRIQRLGGLLSVLTASSCIWPQPVNEESPDAGPVDVAPTIISVNPSDGPLRAYPSGVSCQVQVIGIVAESPFGLPLSSWFYLNYKNGLIVDNRPIKQLNMEPVLSNPLTQQLPNDGSILTITLDDWLQYLKPNGPQTLWVWVSDGFHDCQNAGPCDPTANPGRYATSFSWTIDFTQCPNFPPP